MLLQLDEKHFSRIILLEGICSNNLFPRDLKAGEPMDLSSLEKIISPLPYVRIRTKKELRSFASAEGRQGRARLCEENLCTFLTLDRRKRVEINRNAPDCNPNFIR